MTSKYMRYEMGAKAGVAPLSVKISTNINRMTTGRIFWYLAKRLWGQYSTELLLVVVGALLAFDVVTKL